METGSRPAPKTLSQKDFATHLGVQKGTVSKWKARGLLVLDGEGRVLVEETEWKLDQQPATYRGGQTHRPIRKADANNATQAKAKPKGKQKATSIPSKPAEAPVSTSNPPVAEAAPDPVAFDWSDPNLPMAEAVRRKENFLGLTRKHEFEVEKGQWVRIEDVGSEVEREYAVVRERLLTMPGKLASKLEGLSRAAIELVILDEMTEALNELHAAGDGGDVGDASQG